MSSHDLFARLAGTTPGARTEADIQSDIKTLLVDPTSGFDLPQLEVPTEDGTRRRIDIALGATVIEVKRSLTQDEGTLADYAAQLRGYVENRTDVIGGRYNGILTDGRAWWLYEIDPYDASFQRRSVFTLQSAQGGRDLVDWLKAVLATQRGVSPTAESIEALLGSSSPAYEQDLEYLRSLYRQVSDDPTVQLKRELWARLLRSALGTGFDEVEDLFLDHTLLVIEAAAIGHAIMDIEPTSMIGEPEALLRGDAFDAADIYNVIESDFFDWVLAAGPAGRMFVNQLLRRVAVFDWSRTEHDVLKVLYESVINTTTRKGLGEYYTPDWLAEGIVEKSITDPLNQRVLDPACGSGTFIFHSIRRVLRAADEAGWGNRETIDYLQSNLFGLDIHPVSVVFARITYLLALGDRLSDDRDVLTVPVHLGDSMQWYQPADQDLERVMVRTDGVDLTASAEATTLFDVGEVLAFPLSGIDDPATFDNLVRRVSDLASTYTDATARKPSIEPILRRFSIGESEDADTLRKTFSLLCDLNADGRDSIWSYFIRNQARPLWLSMPSRRVDVLVGNPPWVAYRFMTEDMQEQYRALGTEHGIWRGGQLATNQDLVALFIARTAEEYLNDGGSIAFVTPLGVLSRQTYQGFRTGRWRGDLRVKFTELWDLADVKPRDQLFPVPAAVIYGTKYQAPPGTDFDAPVGFPKTKYVLEGTRSKEGWAKTAAKVTFVETKNVTIDEGAPMSDYRVGCIQGATVTPRMLHFVTEENSAGRLGRATGRVAVTSLRTPQEDARWKGVPSVTGTIESKYIFDVLLGSTLVPFRLLKPWRAVLPISKGELLTPTEIKNRADSLTARWAETTEVWERHKARSSKLSNMSNLDYQGKLSRQLDPPKHRVLYAKAGTRIAAARTENPRYIIDHQLYWLPAANRDEARYLVAILNSPQMSEAVRVYQSVGIQGPRDIDTYVWRLPVPKFDPDDERHMRLVDLSEQGEEVAAGVEIAETLDFKKARWLVRDALDTADVSPQSDELVRDLLHLNSDTDA